MGTCASEWCPTGRGRAHPHIPASAAAGFLSFRATPGSRRRKSPATRRQILWRCVMSDEETRALSGCFVEGDSEQRRRERRVKRRALALSISLQALALAAVILLPLFGT